MEENKELTSMNLIYLINQESKRSGISFDELLNVFHKAYEYFPRKMGEEPPLNKIRQYQLKSVYAYVQRAEKRAKEWEA